MFQLILRRQEISLSKFILVDLAGCEQATTAPVDLQTYLEAAEVNKKLLAVITVSIICQASPERGLSS